MSTVADILKSKSNSAVVSVRPEHSVFEALRLMAEKGIGAVLVMAGKDVQGIFTERDYARKLVLQGRASNQTLVRDVMTCNVLCVRPSQTTEECMAIMTENRLRHLPVVDEAGSCSAWCHWYPPYSVLPFSFLPAAASLGLPPSRE